ncbi:hypothetical protein R3P38DRAFT_961397 [Favolaschia claudopus]|uniref:Transmembrane protein n=1 Tax=Favolaschia claudopus TaxID=2862362 RepID=A0AAW0E695_9AGAR
MCGGGRDGWSGETTGPGIGSEHVPSLQIFLAPCGLLQPPVQVGCSVPVPLATLYKLQRYVKLVERAVMIHPPLLLFDSLATMFPPFAVTLVFRSCGLPPGFLWRAFGVRASISPAFRLVDCTRFIGLPRPSLLSSTSLSLSLRASETNPGWSGETTGIGSEHVPSLSLSASEIFSSFAPISPSSFWPPWLRIYLRGLALVLILVFVVPPTIPSLLVPFACLC